MARCRRLNMLVTLTVDDVMSTPVETIEPAASIREAATALRAAHVGSLVVCEAGRPVGIVTESDIVESISHVAEVESRAIREVMSGELVTADRETSIESAATLMADHDIRRLPVCDGEQVVGIVTTTDLSYYLPHLARLRDDWPERVQRLEDASPSTAYEDPDWSFERVGTGGVSVGDTVRFRKELTDEDVRRFAEASGDTNRLHLDSEFARESRFGSRIVHGMLTAGLISAALARLPGLTIYLSQDLRFLGPVTIGETATAVCEVVEDLGKEKFELTTTVYDAEGDVVIDGDAVVMVTAFPTEDAEEARSGERTPQAQ